MKQVMIPKPVPGNPTLRVGLTNVQTVPMIQNVQTMPMIPKPVAGDPTNGVGSVKIAQVAIQKMGIPKAVPGDPKLSEGSVVMTEMERRKVEEMARMREIQQQMVQTIQMYQEGIALARQGMEMQSLWYAKLNEIKLSQEEMIRRIGEIERTMGQMKEMMRGEEVVEVATTAYTTGYARITREIVKRMEDEEIRKMQNRISKNITTYQQHQDEGKREKIPVMRENQRIMREEQEERRRAKMGVGMIQLQIQSRS